MARAPGGTKKHRDGFLTDHKKVGYNGGRQLTAVTCFSWHLDEGTLDSRWNRGVDVIEDRLVFGIVDLSGGRRLGRLGLFLFGRTGENIQMRATKPFSLSECAQNS